ncbi:MAG TPA: hypothetical protein VJX72_12335 [Candidatus Acidoferrum sp.]|nr:hypothetical protein [Candidatus Acidoferrum sp.]
MSTDDEVEFGGIRAQVQFAQIVQNVKARAVRLDDRGGRELLGPGSDIHVSTHSEDRRNALQLSQNVGLPNVASVDNQIDAVQRSFCLRPEQAMSI